MTSAWGGVGGPAARLLRDGSFFDRFTGGVADRFLVGFGTSFRSDWRHFLVFFQHFLRLKFKHDFYLDLSTISDPTNAVILQKYVIFLAKSKKSTDQIFSIFCILYGILSSFT